MGAHSTAVRSVGETPPIGVHRGVSSHNVSFGHYGRCLVALAAFAVETLQPRKHVGGSSVEAVTGEAAVMRGSAGGRLLLPHGERGLRVPAQKERHRAAVSDSPLSRSVLG